MSAVALAVRIFFCACFLQAAGMLIMPTAAAQQDRSPIDSLLRELVHTYPNSEEQIRCLLSLCYYYNTYKPDSCLFYAERAIIFSKRQNFPYGVAEGTRYLGWGNQRLGRFTDAITQYLRALPLFEQLHDTTGIANTLNGLGISYFEQADYTSALQYYQRAEPLFRAIGNKNRLSAVISNIAYVHLEMNDLVQAKKYAMQAFKLAMEANSATTKVFSLTHLADICRREGLIDSAFIYLNRARSEEAQATKNLFTFSRLHYIWGKTCIQARKFIEARQHLDSSLFFAQQAGMRFRIKDAYQGFQEMYALEGDFRRAYEYQSKVVLYNDSLFNQESARKIATIQREIEAQSQNERIQLLTKNSELQEFQRNVTIGIALVLALAGLGTVRLYRSSNAANKQLAKQNQEILQQQQLLSQQSEEIASINAELEKKNQHLLTLNEEKNHFLAIAAHDLKNPLTGIRSLSEYLGYAHLPEGEVHLLANRISQTSERMFTLVQNLLDINAIESGHIDLRCAFVDVTPIVENIVQQYMESAIEKRITIRFSVLGEIDEGFTVFADENYLLQIFDNIISNAIKYSPFDKQVFVRVLGDPKTIRVEVKDEGQGFSDEDKKHLFGKFTKLSARPTGGEHSTGLGLSIVKQLVDMMNGEIRCESEYLKGATFILEFPRADGSPTPEGFGT